MADVTMPQLGEAVTEGTILRWFKQVGSVVALDEVLYEISTDKVDSEVPSPVAGVVREILANEGDVVEVGQVLARVDESGSAPGPEPADQAASELAGSESAAGAGSRLERGADPGSAGSFASVVDSEESDPQVPAPQVPDSQVPAPQVPAPEETAGRGEAAAGPAGTGSGSAAAGRGGLVSSPIVRRLIADNDLDASGIAGSGFGGRITRADVEAAIRSRVSDPARSDPAASAPAAPPTGTEADATAAASTLASTPATAPPVASAAVSRVPSGTQVVPLNNIRKRTAEHMVMSKQTSPHVLTAIEVDYERVEQVRRTVKAAWQASEGFTLTYLPFIARAVIDALRDYPYLNATFGQKELHVHSDVNLAIAVDIDFDGLLAPVIRGADGKRLRQLARDIVDLAARTRTKQLSPDDLAGGTFTLTNAGQYGTMMQFPIINQPQVAILSTDGVSRKPVVLSDDYGNESIAIHSVGVLAMAWDHRAFDGAYAAAFLNRVREIIQTREWEAEVR